MNIPNYVIISVLIVVSVIAVIFIASFVALFIAKKKAPQDIEIDPIDEGVSKSASDEMLQLKNDEMAIGTAIEIIQKSSLPSDYKM